MNRNIVRVVSILGAGLLLLVFVFRLVMVTFLTPKKATPPGAVSGPTNADSGPLFKNVDELLKEGKRAEAIKILEEIASSEPRSKQTYQSLLMLAEVYKAEGNLMKTKEIYLTIAEGYSEYCNYPDIQKRLTALNMDILFSPILTETSQIYTVEPGDSLSKIAKNYSTTVELIKKANGLKSDIIRPGMKLKVQQLPFSIIVDKSQSILTLALGGEVIKVYPISTGKNDSTPTGTFKIKNKMMNPVWYSTKAVVPPGSPENVLGSRWMGITTPEPGYGIHGTTEPSSIGYQCTEGCVRMHNSDVEELFDIIPLGTEVTIID